MKNLIIIVLLVISNSSLGQKKTEFSEKELQDFIHLVCLNAHSLSGSEQRSKAGSEIENMFLKFLNITRETPDYKLKVTKFWNDYNQYFICLDKPTEITRSPEHFMKRVVALGMYKTIFDDFLLYDEEEYPIDVNTIEMVNGKPETLLDYIDHILADPQVERKYNVREIQSLRRVIIDDYGAKKASELEE